MYKVALGGRRGIALAGIPEKGMSLASRRVGLQFNYTYRLSVRRNAKFVFATNAWVAWADMTMKLSS